jgi:putative transcriptional regulator
MFVALNKSIRRAREALVMSAFRRFAWLSCFAAALAAFAWSPLATAQPGDDSLILVAKPALRDNLYGATILVAKPMSNDRHIGFIVNKPTRVTLGKLFPDHQPSRKVMEPVFLGGPVNSETIFALVQRKDSPGSRSMQITPDLYLVHERDIVDRIIETEADHARFFAGLVLWRPGELESEIRRGFWYVLDADSSLVLRKSTQGMWEELVRGLQQKANTI